MTKVTNLETAVSIVRTSTDKATALADIMNILGVSRSNAFVYHTKASKILFSANNVDEIMGKVSPQYKKVTETCLLYTSPSPRDKRQSRMPSSA